MDPILELQGIVVSRLKSTAAVTALVGQGVYDPPPVADNGTVPAAKYPYISIGPSSSTSDNADCIVADEVIFQIDAWAKGNGYVTVRKMADAIRRAFRDYEFELQQNALVTFDYWRTDIARIGDINHASVRFTAMIEQP